MKEKTVKRIVTMLMSLLIALSMMPALSEDIFAASDDAGNDALKEIGRQFQDRDADPFSFRPGKAGEKGAGTKAQTYPESFDLRNVDTDGDGEGDTSYVTPVKFQNPFGTCWGFAAIAAAETSILGNEKIREGMTAETMDLSEKHLVWFTYQPITDKDNPQYGEGAIYTGESSSGAMNIGGMPFYATSLFASGKGPVLEEVDPEELAYHGKERLVQLRSGEHKKESELTEEEMASRYCYSARDDWSLPEDDRYLQSYRLKESCMLPTPADKKRDERTAAINAIKEQLMEKRAVEIAFCADVSQPFDPETGAESETKYLSSKWAHYTYDSGRANHAVTVIGWDDSYPKENFRHKIKDMSVEESYKVSTPSHDGAWLAKNSWGAETEEFPNKGPARWGLTDEEGKHTGYFWISYDDKSVKMAEALDFDLSNVDKEYLVYQHDYMPVGDVDSAYLGTETSMANVFTAELPSRIEQVSCQTTTPGTKVRYDVYLMNDGAVNPDDGTRVAQIEATYKYGGYHKEDLPEPVTAATGQKFSVVVTQKTPDDLYSINLQAALNKTFTDEYNKEKDEADRLNDYSKGVVNPGESLFLADGKWRDLSEKWIQDILIGKDCRYYDVDNFAIKVFAAEGEEPAPEGGREDAKPAPDSGEKADSGSSLVRGASADAADRALTAWNEDSDPEGTAFYPLRLRSSYQNRRSVRLSWRQNKKAASYVIYGARSGKGNALERIAEVRSNSYTVKSLAGARLKKGAYYKFLIVALDSSDKVVSSSKVIHAATKGASAGNFRKLKVTKPSKLKLKLANGKTYRLKAKATGRKVRKMIGLRYESSDPGIATVSPKGRIKAVSKGSCRICVYAQNGLSRTVKLTVK